MLKKISVLLAMVVSLVFADGNLYDYTSSPFGGNPYGSSSENGYATPAVAPPQEPDLKFSLAFHPIGIIVYEAAMGTFAFWVSFEAGFGNSFSLITRPVFLNGRYNMVDISGFGLMEGFRFYLSNRGHRGWYVEPEIQYIAVSGHRTETYQSWNSYSSRSSSASAGGFGVSVVGGYKVQSGHFVFGVDAGLGFIFASASSDNDEVDDVSRSGFGIDSNIYVGFSF